MDDSPYEPRPGPENVRKLEIVYNRHHPGEGSCVVEYVGDRVKVFEVDRYLIERLLEHLEHWGHEQRPRTQLRRTSMRRH